MAFVEGADALKLRRTRGMAMALPRCLVEAVEGRYVNGVYEVIGRSCAFETTIFSSISNRGRGLPTITPWNCCYTILFLEICVLPSSPTYSTARISRVYPWTKFWFNTPPPLDPWRKARFGIIASNQVRYCFATCNPSLMIWKLVAGMFGYIYR